MKKSICDQCFNRRQMLGAGTLAGVAVVASTAGILSSCGNDEKNKNGASGQAVGTDASGAVNLDFKSYPDLQNAGGSVRINVNGNPLSVTRVSSTLVAAVQAICPHQGATLDDYSNGVFSCPRHGATFSASGVVTGGPTNRDLTKYTATLSATGVKVSLN